MEAWVPVLQFITWGLFMASLRDEIRAVIDEKHYVTSSTTVNSQSYSLSRSYLLLETSMFACDFACPLIQGAIFTDLFLYYAENL